MWPVWKHHYARHSPIVHTTVERNNRTTADCRELYTSLWTTCRESLIVMQTVRSCDGQHFASARRTRRNSVVFARWQLWNDVRKLRCRAKQISRVFERQTAVTQARQSSAAGSHRSDSSFGWFSLIMRYSRVANDSLIVKTSLHDDVSVAR